MRWIKKSIIFILLALIGTAGMSYAVSANSTALETAADLTGKNVEFLYQERAAGKTYCTIANEAGKLDEFKSQILEQKKTILEQRVANGNLTQEQADAIYNFIRYNQANCDGTTKTEICKNICLSKVKLMNGLRHNKGYHYGSGFGNGTGFRCQYINN